MGRIGGGALSLASARACPVDSLLSVIASHRLRTVHLGAAKHRTEAIFVEKLVQVFCRDSYA
jgi:hypothetical protein